MPHLPSHLETIRLPASTLALVAFIGVAVAGCGSRSALFGASEGVAAGGGGAASTGGSGTTITGGSTGVGGTAGAGGAGGDVQSIVEACTIAVSCNAPGGNWPFFSPSSCVDQIARMGWWYDGPERTANPYATSRLLECAAKFPGDCAALATCWGSSTWFGLSLCREGGYCQDGSNEMIGGPGDTALDCTEFGGECTNLWSNAQRACCNSKSCDGAPAVTCDGAKASICGGWGERVDFDCGVSGQTCNPDPYAPCKGSDPCDPMTTPTTCKGTYAVYCSGGGIAVHDCATTQFRTACNEGAPSYEAPCKPKGGACDPEYESGVCEGTVLRVCVDGDWVGVDCAEIGFQACVEDGKMPRCAK